jgi:hypothetical protein
MLVRSMAVADMNSKARLYIGATLLAGSVLMAYCLAQGAAAAHSNACLVYFSMALIASAVKVRLPGIQGTISLNFLFILVSVAVFTFAETVLMAAAASVIQCVWKSRRRPQVIQVLFNAAALAISGGVSYRISHLVGGSRPGGLPVLLVVAASLYFVANTLIVSGVLALIGSKSILQVWQQCYLWSFPYYLAGAAIAALAVSAGQSLGWATSLVVLPVMLLIHVFYRMCVERLVRSA